MSSSEETQKRSSFSQWFKNLAEGLRSPWFLKNLAIYIAVVLVSFVAVFIWLKVYTRHGQKISVPSLKGLDLKAVEEICKQRDLRFEVIDSVYGKFVKPGCVVEQTPEASTMVKKDRKIFLTLRAFAPKKVAMPSLVGNSITQARADLETANLTIGRLTYKPDIAKDNVLEQRLQGRLIEPGTMVEEGTQIDLVLGTGEEKGGSKTIVPNLIGQDLNTASLVAGGSSLNIGSKIFDANIRTAADSAQARVYKQSPRAGRPASQGAEIDIFLTLDLDKIDTGTSQSESEDTTDTTDELNF